MRNKQTNHTSPVQSNPEKKRKNLDFFFFEKFRKYLVLAKEQKSYSLSFVSLGDWSSTRTLQSTCFRFQGDGLSVTEDGWTDGEGRISLCLILNVDI